MRNAFSKERLDFSRSRLEMSLRLASRLYMLGRRAKFGTDGLVDGVKLLSSAIQFFDEAAEQKGRLNPPTLRRLFGMRGVAQLLIARTGDVSLARLKQAAKDLNQSHQLGDQTSQNLVYRRECALRLYELERTVDHLDQLGRMFEESGAVNRQYYADLAWYYTSRFQLVLDQKEAAKHLFGLGIDACNSGLVLPTDINSPDAILFSLRGFLYWLSVQLYYSEERDVSDKHLDLAIEDLRRAAAARLGGASLALALLRRSSFRRAGELTEAEQDLQEGIVSVDIIADPILAQRVRRKLECSQIACTIGRNVEKNEKVALFDSCRQLISYEDEVTRHGFTLIWAVRALIKEFDELPIPTEIRSLAETAIDISERHIRSLPSGDDAVGHAKGYLAGISRKLDGGSVSRRTLTLFRSAVDASNKPSTELYSSAADTALRLAKSLAREGKATEAASLFEDAARWYERAFETFEQDPAAVSEGFLSIVCHSKAGEAYLRMRRGTTGSGSNASKAIEHLTKARQLGNETAELLGLLGDGYYRRGYPTSSKDDLIKAVELKVAAQKGGGLSRENWSILARLYLRLYEIEGEIKNLSLAFQAVHESNAVSPSWPWPLFQMAELTALPAKIRAEALSRCSLQVTQSEIMKALGFADRTLFLNMAAKLAVDGTEFQRDVIGGRSRVFVLDDPHRLLSTTIVLKPTNQKNADVEIDTTKIFGEHLRTSGFGQRFGVPNPIAVIPAHGDAVTYIMERARATPLSNVVLGEFVNGYRGEITEVTGALELLQIYHRWSGVKDSDRQWRKRFASDFRKLIKRINMEASELYEAVKNFEELLPEKIPLLRKKDAHPENWLVTNRGRIVMIDLEATSLQPALLDVAQLIDDYPIFAADQEGWSARIAIAARYWKSVFGTELPQAQIEPIYTAVVIVRCVVGLLRCTEDSDSASSLSLRTLDLRIRHFETLLSFVATCSTSPAACRLAVALCHKTRTLSGPNLAETGQPEIDVTELMAHYGPSTH